MLDIRFILLPTLSTAGSGKALLSRSATLPSRKLNAGRKSRISRRIDKVEADALYQEDLVEQLTHTGKGKSGAVVELMKAMGSVGAVKHRVETEQYRAEAARMRDELAQVESQNQSSVAVLAP